MADFNRAQHFLLICDSFFLSCGLCCFFTAIFAFRVDIRCFACFHTNQQTGKQVGHPKAKIQLEIEFNQNITLQQMEFITEYILFGAKSTKQEDFFYEQSRELQEWE